MLFCYCHATRLHFGSPPRCVNGPIMNTDLPKIAEITGDEDSDEKSRTFLFYDEGHTLGNALRCVIAAYPEVMFCGYTVPHPSETKMHFRIQTNGPRALEILQRGLKDLEKLCDHTLEKFEEAMLTYKTERMST